MKKENGFIKFLLVLIVITLAGIIMLFGYVMYNEFFGDGNIVIGNFVETYPSIENQESNNKVNSIQTSKETKIDVSTGSTTKTEEKEYENKYLYSQLSDYGKIIYKKLYENKENLKTGTYELEFGNAFYNIFHKKMEVMSYKKNIKQQ